MEVISHEILGVEHFESGLKSFNFNILLLFAEERHVELISDGGSVLLARGA